VEAAPAEWRGVIEHVPSGQRRYLNHLEDVTAFIAPYLVSIGVKLGLSWRIKQWLRRQKLRGQNQT
jgi:hypothetical protein